MGIVECEGLTKRYGRQTAVDAFSASVEEGEVFGLLGPNGAGKTTLFRLLLGLARPNSGTARIMGRSVPCPSAVLRHLGAMVEEPAFYKWMGAHEQLRVHALAAGVKVGPGDIGAALERVGLADAGKKPAKKYSQGMRQRLGLARAILHRPRVLVLDEPANGLDPAGIVWLRELIRDLAKSGTTIIVSSHQLGEIEKVCDRVAIINRGRVIEVGGVADIGGEQQSVHVVVCDEDLEAATAFLTSPHAENRGNGHFIVPNIDSRRLLKALVARGVYPQSITQEQASLEKRFLEITGGLD
jgi:ABC-2 type transport system ATP-binding protein